MALIRPSALVAGISGSVGGVTFANTKAGAIVRHRPRRIPTKTAAILQQQAIFASLTRQWSALTDAQRASWRTLAANFPRTNRLGQASPLTGFSMYLKSNLFAEAWAGFTYTAPPNEDNRMKLASISATATAPATISVTINLELNDEPTTVAIYGARPFSKAAPKFLRNWRIVLLDELGPTPKHKLDLSAPWLAVFGPLQATEALAVRVRVLNIASQVLPAPALQHTFTVA